LARGATAGLLDRWRAGSLTAAILSLPLDGDDLHWDTLLGEPIVEAVPRRGAARLLRGAPQIECRPEDRQRPHQIVDIRLAVQR
jgi:hypothetical protein